MMSAPVISFLIFLATLTNPITGLNTRKLDDTTVTGPPDTEIKCGSCPCNTPCAQSPPPPPPPSPPPPQQITYASPPPPTPKKPPTPGGVNCPPPPSSPGQYIYITGPPGNIYPVDPYFSNSGRRLAAALPLLMTSALVGLLAFW